MNKPVPKPRMRNVRVKELSERDRRRLLRHFIDLDRADRLLRFGSMVADEVIAQYVQKLDFARDKLFGVYNFKFRLIGVGHLAFAPKEQVKLAATATSKANAAELGVSVSKSARGMGVGSKLFERAAIHCRNADVDTLYMQCLATNQTMMHIAKKAGMEIHREYGEADAYLKLLPADPSSVLQEAMEEQVATLDYAFKLNARAIFKWVRSLPGLRKP